MEFNVVDRQYLDTEIRYFDQNVQVAKFIIDKYKTVGFYHKYDDNPLNSLLYNYFYLKKDHKHLVLEKILNEYGFNYISSIHNAIYHLLEGDEKALLWPGIEDFSIFDGIYKLKTNKGIIMVRRASDFFKNSKTSYIFEKPLKGWCFARSFDFIKENKDYKAVLSYDNNLFVGGHYHAYLENNEKTLDIASNALYMSKEEARKVLQGKIIKSLSYEEIITSFNKLLYEIPDLSCDDDKLQVLALYYGNKSGIK